MNNFIWSRLAQTRKDVPFFFEEFIPNRDDQEADVNKVLGGVQDIVHQMSKDDILDAIMTITQKTLGPKVTTWWYNAIVTGHVKCENYFEIELHTIFRWSPRYCTIDLKRPNTEGFQANLLKSS